MTLTIPTHVRRLLTGGRFLADCRRRKVAAVALDVEGLVISVGWNGLREGSCLDGDCPRGAMTYEEIPAFSDYSGNCAALHAEDMALRGAGDLAATLFVTCEPCPGCAVLCANAGVDVIVIDPATL